MNKINSRIAFQRSVYNISKIIKQVELEKNLNYFKNN